MNFQQHFRHVRSIIFLIRGSRIWCLQQRSDHDLQLYHRRFPANTKAAGWGGSTDIDGWIIFTEGIGIDRGQHRPKDEKGPPNIWKTGDQFDSLRDQFDAYQFSAIKSLLPECTSLGRAKKRCRGALASKSVDQFDG